MNRGPRHNNNEGGGDPNRLVEEAKCPASVAQDLSGCDPGKKFLQPRGPGGSGNYGNRNPDDDAKS